jgi:hypothetical protein
VSGVGTGQSSFLQAVIDPFSKSTRSPPSYFGMVSRVITRTLKHIRIQPRQILRTTVPNLPVSRTVTSSIHLHLSGRSFRSNIRMASSTAEVDSVAKQRSGTEIEVCLLTNFVLGLPVLDLSSSNVLALRWVTLFFTFLL